MSDLTAFEGRKLEKLLGMGSGYVLNFSDRTYSEFFIDYRIDIDAAQYRTGGDSKAKRMRTFWAVAPNNTVGRVLEGLIAYGIDERCLGDSSHELIDACRVIAQRLLADQPVALVLKHRLRSITSRASSSTTRMSKWGPAART